MPILIIIIMLFLAVATRRVYYILRIRKKVRNSTQHTTSLIRAIMSACFLKSVLLTNPNAAVSIEVVFTKRKNAQYHFTTKQKIEIYVGVIEAHPTLGRRHYWGEVSWRLKGCIRLQEKSIPNRIIIFTRTPMDITSSDIRAKHLGSGDVFFGSMMIYSMKHFLDHYDS